jgi:hypothetical protein
VQKVAEWGLFPFNQTRGVQPFAISGNFDEELLTRVAVDDLNSVLWDKHVAQFPFESGIRKPICGG